MITETTEITAKDEMPKADLRKFNKAEEQVNKALAALDAIPAIETPEQYENAMTVLKGCSTVEKMIETKRTELVKPLNDRVKEINAYAKSLAGKLPPAIQKGKDKILVYNKEQQRKLEELRYTSRSQQLATIGFEKLDDGRFQCQNITIQESQIKSYDDNLWNSLIKQSVENINLEIQRKLEEQKKASELDDAFADETDEPVKTSAPAPVTYTPSIPAPTAAPVKGITKTWTYDVIDPDLVPREYLMVDTSKITAAVRSGVRTIPGVNIYQKEGVTLR